MLCLSSIKNLELLYCLDKVITAYLERLILIPRSIWYKLGDRFLQNVINGTTGNDKWGKKLIIKSKIFQTNRSIETLHFSKTYFTKLPAIRRS